MENEIIVEATTQKKGKIHVSTSLYLRAYLHRIERKNNMNCEIVKSRSFTVLNNIQMSKKKEFTNSMHTILLYLICYEGKRKNINE